MEHRLEQAKPIIFNALRLKDADFDVHLVSNSEMEKIRRTLVARPDWKGVEARKIAAEEAVNVLAFPEPAGFPHPESGKRFLGEVYLNAGFGGGDYATLGPLLVHGLLHLLGYRHYFERDRIKMQKREKLLWDHLSSPDSM